MIKGLETHVAVLGAGLAGTCTALELARQGVEVLLMDQDPVPINRASLRNEGKIHLGLIYANDPTRATARLQLRGALCFRSLLERWLGEAADSLVVSTPFHYLVARDSVLSPEELGAHYAWLSGECAASLDADERLDYLGHRPRVLAQRLMPEEYAECFAHAPAQAIFRTEELAVDTEHLARLLREAVAAHPLIRFMGGHRVQRIDTGGSRIVVHASSPEGPVRIEARQAVNATWEQRFALDRTAGLDHTPGWVHRLKYRIIARLPESSRMSPSATIVLGRYGDVVVRPDGTAYLSWYPTGMRGWTHDIAPPESWEDPCRGEPSEEIAREVLRGALSELDKWYDGIAECEPLLIDAGAIVAYGKTDVDDARSGLHDRTRIGVTSLGGYHSLDPGKLTTAPLFGVKAAEGVLSVFAAERARS